LHCIIGNKFRIENKVFYRLIFDREFDKINDIGVLNSHAFKVSRVNFNSVGLSIEMNLSTEAIILILASEGELFKPVQDLSHTLSWFGKHRLDWNAHSDVTLLFEF
jgi:hypothetical protein